MSPIIELQQRAVEAGRLRAGDRDERGNPRKIRSWRMTSKDKVRLEAAAALWGGEVKAWEGHDGEWELYTDVDTLPIMLMPGQLPSTWYELWSKGGCQRRCDGQHEVLSDSPCLCGDESRECKPTTRLSVLLPDIPGLGSWLLSSTGWNAAVELAASAKLLGRAAAEGVLLPARLRLEQRVDVKGGTTRRYAVPVLDVDVSFRELLGMGGASQEIGPPPGYTPLAIEPGNGRSLGEALAQTEQQELVRTTRSAAPVGHDESESFGTAPLVPDQDPGEGAVTLGGQPEADETPPAPPQDVSPDAEKPLTDAMVQKLNALVGQLREPYTDKEGKEHPAPILTEHLWAALANERKIGVDQMIDLLHGRDDEHVLHWSPLRDSLTRAEARALHARLAKKWKEIEIEKGTDGIEIEKGTDGE